MSQMKQKVPQKKYFKRLAERVREDCRKFDALADFLEVFDIDDYLIVQ
jgi:hypothetical protein